MLAKVDADFLDRPLTVLPGVGPTLAHHLSSLDLLTVKDLLYYLPFRYDDLSLRSSIATLQAGETVTVNGHFQSLSSRFLRSGKTLQTGLFSDGTGTLSITWFNQPYIVNSLLSQPQISLSGKVVTYRGQLTLMSPQYEIGDQPPIHTGRLIPIYHETARVSSKRLRSLIYPLLDRLDPTLDFLPPPFLSRYHLVPLPKALQMVHFPKFLTHAQAGKERLAFEELLLLNLSVLDRKRRQSNLGQAIPIPLSTQDLSTFLDHLPFALTPDQVRSLHEIVADLNRSNPMNRLLQGDVGSGKTVIAAAALYASARQGLPGILMAPTDILARQHARTITALFKPLGLKVSLQTSSDHNPIDTPVIIGTHAVLHRQLPNKIGVVVIDEQHRFGVSQRTALLKRSPPPHLLSLSATPIPRTIALTLYAELAISTLDTMPLDHPPVKTWVVPSPKREAAYKWVQNTLTETGGQAFFVCPLIDPSASPLLDLVKAVTDYHQHLKSQIYPHLRLGLLHGRLSTKDKQAVIQAFTDHQLDILVTTPVIEVGIDIPNATVMLIESAERFGLASLHQLRGRVGRRDKAGYCLLFTSSASVPARLKYMEKVHSGFRLSELDLKLRGPGELFGTRQTGYLDLKYATLTDNALLLKTHRAAVNLLDQDPALTHYPTLAQKLSLLLANSTQAN